MRFYLSENLERKIGRYDQLYILSRIIKIKDNNLHKKIFNNLKVLKKKIITKFTYASCTVADLLH